MSTFNLGTLPSGGTPVSKRSTINNFNAKDLYSFQLGSDSNINIGLTGLQGDLSLKLFRDSNNNGIIDATDKLVASSDRFNLLEESINLSSALTDVGPGSYIAQVDRKGTANTQYDFRVSAGPVSKILALDGDFGAISSPTTSRSGSVENTDTTDIYAMAINVKGFYHFGLSGLSANADLRLIQDRNNNRIVDSTDLVVSSIRSGTTSEGFVQNLDPATNYFLEVSQAAGNTNYTVTVTQI